MQPGPHRTIIPGAEDSGQHTRAGLRRLDETTRQAETGGQMLFTRGRPAIRALIGVVLIVIGVLLHGRITLVAGVIVTAWGVVASLAAWRNRGLNGLIGGKGDSGSLR
jgi:hypothetical protein